MKPFTFTLEKTVGKARAGSFTTPHGTVQTPIFMPVGTQATVKALDAQDINSTGAQIILGNTYHLYLRPGHELVAQQGGVQQFMNWHKPMLTDSGGFQVFSLGQQAKDDFETMKVKIGEEGVEFTSHHDGSSHFFSPEKSIEIQRHLGADIIMAFDECTPDQATPEYAREALGRTHRWAQQCFNYWESKQRLSEQGKYQGLFGIVQGAMHPELRKESAEYISNIDFDGIAVGGETIGYNMQGTAEVMSWIESILPTNKPRYAMGLGRDPQDIIDAVLMGFDMFDCVGPTRLARNGALYHGHLDAKDLTFNSQYAKGRLSIGKQEFAADSDLIQPDCDCYTCQQGYTRSYLHHLYKTKELSYYRLASIHNVRFMIRLTEQLRAAILSM
jgi:queuine tRNA-ribosyltransferase